jgi:hypothetical protein
LRAPRDAFGPWAAFRRGGGESVHPSSSAGVSKSVKHLLTVGATHSKAPADASLRPPGLSDAFLQPMMRPMPPNARSCVTGPILAIYFPKRQLFEFDKPIRANSPEKRVALGICSLLDPEAPALHQFVSEVLGDGIVSKRNSNQSCNCLFGKPTWWVEARALVAIVSWECIKEVQRSWWLSTSPQLVYIPMNRFCLQQSNHYLSFTFISQPTNQ